MQEENKSIVFIEGQITVQIDANIIDTMLKYRQIHCLDKESGGILLGRKSKINDIKFIDCITTPFPKDKASRFMFKRLDNKHIDFYQEVNKVNGLIYSYEGEWHTHPEDFPNFSCIDKKNWIRIANEFNVSDKVFFHIIVGRKAIGIWSVSLKTLLINKIAEKIV